MCVPTASGSTAEWMPARTPTRRSVSLCASSERVSLHRARAVMGNDEAHQLRARDTGRMKVQATIVISYRADSFGEAGGALDDVLQRAREREDVEIESIQLGTPASAGPVSLPYVERPPDPPQRVPHPLPNGARN